MKDIFRQVGPVISFRMVYDKDSGKPKGYGFCEFVDAETAHSAIRNLNNYEINGRSLRVDFAENDKSQASAGGPGIHQGAGPRVGGPSSMGPTSIPNPSPAQQWLGGHMQGGNPLDEIIRRLNGISTEELYGVMVQMKGIIDANPQQARDMLVANPALAHALLQAQVRLAMLQPPPVPSLPSAPQMALPAPSMPHSASSSLVSNTMAQLAPPPPPPPSIPTNQQQIPSLPLPGHGHGHGSQIKLPFPPASFTGAQPNQPSAFGPPPPPTVQHLIAAAAAAAAAMKGLSAGQGLLPPNFALPPLQQTQTQTGGAGPPPPPPPVQLPPSGSAPGPLHATQNAIDYLLNLSADVVANLPSNQQDQIRKLKAMYGRPL